VSDIDGRDNDGRSLGLLSTYENQFLLGMGFMLSPQVSAGVGFKLYLAKLYDQVTTTRAAVDLGLTYLANKNLSIGLAVRDIGAMYKWETSKVYGNSGTVTENKFPTIVDVGATYNLPKNLGIFSLGVGTYIDPKFSSTDEFGVVTKSDQKYNFTIRFGSEININEYVKVRAGIDRMDLNSDDFFGNIKPGAGIGVSKSFSKGVTLGLDYSFQFEPYSQKPMQNIGIAFKFK
jgi:opacity protein-like surface antigen